MNYRVIIECSNYYGTPLRERIEFVEKYLKETLGNVQVRMFESEISPNLILPQVLIDFDDGNPESFIRKIDSILASITLTAIRAVVSKVTTHGAEGAIVGGVTGAAAAVASNKKDTLPYLLIGTLFGSAVGNFLKDEDPVLAAFESGDWLFQKIETGI
jgi:hypothetical protein